VATEKADHDVWQLAWEDPLQYRLEADDVTEEDPQQPEYVELEVYADLE